MKEFNLAEEISILNVDKKEEDKIILEYSNKLGYSRLRYKKECFGVYTSKDSINIWIDRKLVKERNIQKTLNLKIKEFEKITEIENERI
jgi:hypothetical protein